MAPLSLDMYTPAIPHMTEVFNTTESIVNLTLVGYFLFFAVGMLLFGPVSDKYGRKPVLFSGMLTFTAGSAFCALAPDIWSLVAFRVLQALGAGAVTAVGTAIVRDAFAASRRELVLSILQVMLVVGPMLAPVIGALIVEFADWRYTFWTLSGIGAVCLVLTALYSETLPKNERFAGSALGSALNLKSAFTNKGFIAFLLILSAFSLPFMAYISVASYIYIDFFDQSELAYSVFFGLAAIIGAVGPFVWQIVKRFWTPRTFTSVLLTISTASGALMFTAGQINAVLFCITFLVFALTESCVRPYCTNILLSQDIDAGVAASMINCLQTAAGCVGMAIAVLPWPNFVVGLAVIIAATMCSAGIGWLALLHSTIPLWGIKGRRRVFPRRSSARHLHAR